jgi:Coenzyme PQQ synthesis protein D (PqqD)
MTTRFQRADRRCEYFADGVCVALGEDEWALLEGTAVSLWELLGTPISLPELTGALERRFLAPEQTIQTDVKATLRQWIEKGIVIQRDSGPAF